MFAVAHCDDLDALNKEKEYEINQMSETVVVESVTRHRPPLKSSPRVTDRSVIGRGVCPTRRPARVSASAPSPYCRQLTTDLEQ